MNIAIFTPNQNPYSETFIQTHKNYLKGKIFYYYGNNENIRIEGVQKIISKKDAFILKVKKKFLKKPSHYVWRKAVIYSLKQHNIDVVLVEYGTHAHQILPIIKESKIPMVVHFHGYDASVYEAIKKCNNYNEVFTYASSVIAVSRKMEEMLLNIGCPRNKLVYNVYGPQTEFETVVPTFDKKQFIGIGRFTDKKAPYYTILAFKKVVHKHPDAQLLLAGDGALLNSCLNLIKYYKLEANIKLLGVIKPEEYRGLIKNSRAFVQHSITALNGDMEGTPLAILEASAAGIPVISTLHAGIPDVVKHEKTGLLSSEHDVETMAIHMEQLLDDIEFAKQLGAAGKTNITNNFNIKKHIDLLQTTIENAVNNI